MRSARLALALATLAAASPIPLVEHQARRAALRKELGDAMLVLFGASERESGDLRTGFFQEPNFLYLTGWEEPGAILVMSPDEEALLLPSRSERRERYTGRKLAPGDPDAAARTGFATVLGIGKLEGLLERLAERHEFIYSPPSSPRAASLKAMFPLRDLSDPTNAIARLRMVKSPREIELIERTTRVTMDAHRAAWSRIKPGLFEYQVAATMMNVYFEQGCERNAYPPIVGSGPTAVVLHYAKNSRRIDSGELVLMDVGAECAGYAADITRTVPATGRFTARQRELYDVVLGAQKAAIAAAKPGMTLTGEGDKSLVKIARDYIDSRGKDLKGASLGRYFTHGIGHHVGLEVHDATDPARPLAAGMVITIEPGLYIPEENIGIRIEDMVLITANGARVLSAPLAREPADIERAMSPRP
jgi:Xaa-Pro aminopeptidase